MSSMKVHIVFTRFEESFISRAILWFSQRKREMDRRCAHVLIRFTPFGGVFTGASEWWKFEAMERGVWPSIWKEDEPGSVIVAEFKIEASEDRCFEVMGEALKKYNDWWYDYAGIGIWAYAILLKRWCGTLVKWFNWTFRPKAAKEALFCSGLALEVVRMFQREMPDKDFGMAHLTPRTSTPQNEIDICFDNPNYTFIRGAAD